MKKLTAIIAALLFTMTQLGAMPYEEARSRARFLTDKMAYELNLNDYQYNDAYEINLDYLMNIRTESDLDSRYLSYRNDDFRCILQPWQYTLFCAADYFFRPVLWRASNWFFPVYNHYHSHVFYYDAPRVYIDYRGGHCNYRHHHHVSYYVNRRPAWTCGMRGESRGPITHRPHISPGRKEGRPFHFEPMRGNGINNMSHPNRNNTSSRPGRDYSSSRPGRGNTSSSPSRGNTSSSRNNSQTVSRPGRGNTASRTSGYSRPSSTRTTVNRNNAVAPGRSSSMSRSRSSSFSRNNAGASSRSNRSATPSRGSNGRAERR